jgi:hypothetical protein
MITSSFVLVLSSLQPPLVVVAVACEVVPVVTGSPVMLHTLVISVHGNYQHIHM